jgi:hypothetical protein
VCIACILYPICCTISNVFLVLTFVVYLILPDLHGPLFGKVVLAFIVALFAAYLTMTINAFGGIDLLISESDNVNEGCRFLGFLIQVQYCQVLPYW